MYPTGLHMCTQLGTVGVMQNEALDPDSLALIGAVKAELGRRGVSGVALTDVLDLGRNAIYERLRGKKAFTTTDLIKICQYLDISLETLIASARVGAASSGRQQVAA